MNEVFKDVFEDKRKLFVVVAIVVPFLAYCFYYYADIIKNAPYRFDQFSAMQFKTYREGKLRTSFDSRSGDFQYYSKNDSLVKKTIHITKDQLHQIHTKMMDIIFWNVPKIAGDSTQKEFHSITLYYIQMAYQRKTKTVWWQLNYLGEPKLNARMGEMVSFIEKILSSYS